MKFKLDEDMLRLIETSTGMTQAQLTNVSLSEVEQSSKERDDSFYCIHNRREIPPRGSVFLIMDRILPVKKVLRWLSWF